MKLKWLTILAVIVLPVGCSGPNDYPGDEGIKNTVETLEAKQEVILQKLEDMETDIKWLRANLNLLKTELDELKIRQMKSREIREWP